MNLKSMYKKQFLFWLGTVLCVLLMVDHPKAETINSKTMYAETKTADTEGAETKQKYIKINRDFKDPSPVDVIANVMIVDTKDYFIFIAEQRFYVAEFKVNGQVQRTELKDMGGNKIGMDDFTEGDRVEVVAIELDHAQHKYVALTIKMLPPK